jgi:hypothetical protein
MSDGKINIEGLKELNDLILEVKKNMSGLIGTLSDTVKANDKSIESDNKKATTLKEVNTLLTETTVNETNNNKIKKEAIKKTDELIVAEQRAAKIKKDHIAIMQAEAILNDKNSGLIERQKAELTKLRIEKEKLVETDKNYDSEVKRIITRQNELAEELKKTNYETQKTYWAMGNTEPVVEAVKSLELELRENITALAKMKAAGQDMTPEYKKLIATTGELQDTIADTRAEIKMYASDTKGLDMAVGVFQGIGSAAQVAEGSMALLGMEGEDVNKSIQKMVAIQSVLNGVQEIGNALQKESSFMMGVNAVKNKTAAIAQSIYTAAVGTSTGALKVFKIALLSTGIGAIIVGIGLLIEKFDKLKSAIGFTNKNLESFNKETAKYDLISSIKNKKIQDEIDLMKAKGATDLETSNKVKQIMQNEIQATKDKIALNEKLVAESDGKEKLRLSNLTNGLKNELKEQERQMLLFDAKTQTAKSEKAIKDADEATKLYEKQKKEREDRIKEQEELQEEFEAKAKEQYDKAQTEAYEEKLNALNEQYAQELTAAGSNQKAREDADKAHQERLLQNDIFYAMLTLTTAQKGSADYLAAQRFLSETSIAIAKQTSDEKINIELAEQKKRDEAQTEAYEEELNALNEQYAQELTAAGSNQKAREDADKAHQERLLQNDIFYAMLTLTTAQKGSADYLAAQRFLSETSIAIAKQTSDEKINIELAEQKKRDEIAKRTKDMLLSFGESAGEIFANMQMKQKDSAKQALKEMIKMAINHLKAIAYTQLGIAEVMSLATADSIATFGVSGLARAAVLAALITGAATAAEFGANSLIDKFAKGTKDAPGGLAFVGEQGRELITLPDGSKFLSPSTATLVDLPKHSEVLPANMLHKELMESIQGLSNSDSNIMANSMISQLETKKIVDAINNKKSVIVNVDKKGVHVLAKEGQAWTNYANQRYIGRV